MSFYYFLFRRNKTVLKATEGLIIVVHLSPQVSKIIFVVSRLHSADITVKRNFQ